MTNKESILQAALELFAENGYDGAATSRIAQRAGVSEALIFRHFGNKAGLLEAILQTGLAQVAHTMQAYAAPGLAPAEAIAAHIGRSFQLVREHATFWRLVQQLRFQTSVQQQFAQSIEAANQFIIRSLTQHFQQLGARSPELAAWLLFAQIDGITIHYLHDPAQYPLDAMQEQLIEFYRHGNFLDQP